jgi:hypothetical protein
VGLLLEAIKVKNKRSKNLLLFLFYLEVFSFRVRLLLEAIKGGIYALLDSLVLYLYIH